MPRLKKTEEPVVEEPVVEEPVVEEPVVEEPVVEEPVVEEPVVEEPVVEEPKEIDLLAGKLIGALIIVKSSKVVINSKEYIKLILSDRTETILSESDLKEQLK